MEYKTHAAIISTIKALLVYIDITSCRVLILMDEWNSRQRTALHLPSVTNCAITAWHVHIIIIFASKIYFVIYIILFISNEIPQ